VRRSASFQPVAEELARPKAIIETADEAGDLRIVDPLFARWVRQHGGARLKLHVFPHSDGFAVTDGPSLAFLRSTHESLAEAEAEADRIAARTRGSDVMVYDTDDPNDLPEWAVPTRPD
jgi:hypothetical protein